MCVDGGNSGRWSRKLSHCFFFQLAPSLRSSSLSYSGLGSSASDLIPISHVCAEEMLPTHLAATTLFPSSTQLLAIGVSEMVRNQSE